MNLLFPFLVEIMMIDHVATATSGGQVGGRRLIRTENANDGSPREKKTQERTVRALAQFESGSYRQLTWTPSGDTPRAMAGLLFDRDDLEERGLINGENSLPTFRNGDRLVAAYDKDTGELLARLDDPGIRITEVKFLDKLPGFSQLYLASLEDRPQGGSG